MTTKPVREPLAVTLSEAARLLSCSRNTVSKLLREGRLHGVRFGDGANSTWRIPVASIDALLEGRAYTP